RRERPGSGAAPDFPPCAHAPAPMWRRATAGTVAGVDPLLLLTLAGLALVDSTSLGTLVVPLWLMTAPTGLRPGRVLAFLAVVALCYLGVGALLLLGGSAVLDAVGSDVADSRAVLVVQLAIGVALFAASFRVGSGTAARLARWRDRAVG